MLFRHALTPSLGRKPYAGCARLRRARCADPTAFGRQPYGTGFFRFWSSSLPRRQEDKDYRALYIRAKLSFRI